jgi:hypothetical protein
MCNIRGIVVAIEGSFKSTRTSKDYVFVAGAVIIAEFSMTVTLGPSRRDGSQGGNLRTTPRTQ